MAYTTINKSTDYFNTVLYTGNGSYGHGITGVGFQPDWVWIKSRSGTHSAGVHELYDAVRGTDKMISTNSTNAEATGVNRLHSFDSDGFTVDDHNQINGSSTNYASWNWKAGTTSGITQGGASITPTGYSFNQTSGFSIIKYTGTGSNATVPHGLGKVPKMIIARNITDAEQWTTYHVGLDDSSPEDYHVRLNTTDGRVDEASVWNDTAPTANVFSVGSSGAPNGSGDNHIAYCFAEIQGYSKIGSYRGTGDIDGPFIYTGFKPAFLLTKERSSGTGHWRLRDNKRFDQHNPIDKVLRPNTSEAEIDEDDVDFLSNGFKIRTTGGENNGTDDRYLYIAFAAAPLVGSNNVPCTAR